MFVLRTLLPTIYENFCSGPPLEKILDSPLRTLKIPNSPPVLPMMVKYKIVAVLNCGILFKNHDSELEIEAFSRGSPSM